MSEGTPSQKIQRARKEQGSGKFFSLQRRVVLSDEDLVVLVNSYVQSCRKKNGTLDAGAIIKKLGWNIAQWSAFKAKCGQLINWDVIPKFSVLETAEVIDPNGVKQGLQERGIEPEAIVQKIDVHFGQLRRDLYSIGLTREEVNAALAMQNFGENRFANAMEMISSGVFATAAKLQTEQRTLEERLKAVRLVIAEYGGIPSEERDGWVKEEQSLIKSYSVIGKLLSDIQDTWYQGSAKLALLRMRMRDDGKAATTGSPVTQRSGRPRFSPRVVDVDSSPPEIPQPSPPDDQGTNPIGNADAAP